MRSRSKLLLVFAGYAILILRACLSTAEAQSWNAGLDLAENEKPDQPDPSSTELSNPNGRAPEWSYGYRASVSGTALTLFAGAEHENAWNGNENLEGWSDFLPVIVANVSGGPIPYFQLNQVLQADELVLHPVDDPVRKFPVVRWTAPASATYQISATWRDLDANGGDGIDAHVVQNGSAIYDVTIPNGSSASDSRTVSLQGGDVLDVVVGPAGGQGFDTTALKITIVRATTSATWLSSPSTGDWSSAANWSPATIPNGPSYTAIFANSNQTAVSLSGAFEVNGITFNPGANPFTITVGQLSVLTISGLGITNNSGTSQTFALQGNGGNSADIEFTNRATAGNCTFTFAGGSGATFVNFHNGSSAGSSSFALNAGGFSPEVDFYDTSSAGSGRFTINGGQSPGAGIVNFRNAATASNAILTANSGFIGTGGSIQFFEDSSGGGAQVELSGAGTGNFKDGNLDISSHNAPGVAIGSLKGSGTVFLGGNNLTVGANNLRTSFFGRIADGGRAPGTGGSVTKVGTGSLTLTKANTYTGGTTLNKGRLFVNNKTGSGTGTGPVQVNSGTLGGSGFILGAATIGTGSKSGALIAPGSGSKSGTLTVSNTVTFNARSTYKCALNRSAPVAAGAISASGVTINSGVPFTLVDTDAVTLATGTVLTVVNNTSTSPIAGTFSNLADGSTFTSNGNNFQASYTGGTGNDLTLTVQ